jgi:geranylgeranyl diphosphate synthase type II
VTPDLARYLSVERDRVEAALQAALPGAEDRDPVVDACRYALAVGGKRLRPILCVTAYRALGRPVSEPVYRLAASLELVHTYSLVHDDLPSMDDDDVRRGRPATHVVHGVPAAILAGAALIPRAVGVAAGAAADLGLADGVRRELVVTLCSAAGAGGMVGGQALDLVAEGRQVSLPELERIHRLKTGALLAAAPVVGGIAAGADPVTRDALRTYGESLGLAFQITDDILDVTGTTAVLGKTAGRDLQLEKATFPGLAGLDTARARAVAEVDAACAALEAAGVQSEELVSLAQFVIERDR